MSALEYRENAQECLGWARTARSERERDIFLQMARTWLEVAERAAEREGLPEIGQSIEPAYVPPEDTNLFRVKVPGWYAFDHDHVPVLGPFNSNEECMEAIKRKPWLDR